jgi:DNA repair exonuclease SbcCD ATPase subunit
VFESLAGILIVTVLFLVLLLVAIPEFLRWLAGYNVRQRHYLVQAIRRLENNFETIARQLEPYRILQAPQYRQIYDSVTGQLQQIQSNRRSIASPSSMYFPRVPATGWPVRHFVNQPEDAARILTMFRRLRQLQKVVDRGQATLTTVQQDLGRLQQMPMQFKHECEAALARLQAVRTTLQEERKEGLTLLEALEAEYGRLQHTAITLSRQLGAPSTVSLEQADHIGRTLRSLDDPLADLEQQTQSIHQERVTFDRQYQEATKGLADMKAGMAGLDESSGRLTPLFTAIHTLQNEAWQLRQQVAFPQAEALLTDGKQLVAFGKAVITTTLQVNDLLTRQDDFLTPDSINHTGEELQMIYGRLQEHIGRAARRQQFAPLPRYIHESLATMTTHLQQIQGQVQNIEAQHRMVTRQLEREADQRINELTRAWRILQKIVPLAEGDPLTKRYRGLLQQREAMKGKPVQLQIYSARVSELSQDIQATDHYLRSRLQAMAESMRSFPAFVNQAEQQAGEWLCLQPYVAQIKENATTIRQLWPKIAAAKRLAETHQRLDQIKLLHQQMQHAYREMVSHLHQLDRLDKVIQEKVALIETPDDPDPVRTQRVLSVLDLHYNQAIQANSCAEALDSLQQAEKFVNERLVR